MHTPQDEASTLMETFAAKCKLQIQQGHIEVEAPSDVLPSFLLIRKCWIFRLLTSCAVDKATGPDTLPARILRECANEVATPRCFLARGMLKLECGQTYGHHIGSIHCTSARQHTMQIIIAEFI